MIATPILAALILAQNSMGPSSSACAGADPAIVSASVKKVSSDAAGANHYLLSGTVKNLGRAPQASNVLQTVQIYYEDDMKIDSKGIPPLKPGQTYTFTHEFIRAADAGAGTTTFRFNLTMLQPPGQSPQDCNRDNDTYRVRV